MRTPSVIRDLARAYADGKVDRRSYVLERRRIIDEIVSNTRVLEEPPLKSPEVTPIEEKPPESKLGNFDSTLEIPRPDLQRAWVIVIGAGLCLFGALAWLWRHQG
ncbi:MAG: hypothetical protein EXR86_08910 [Gammaproteobacteria bacterium]|nr:hypothetical protein [Gammaproteobacteria bacterium]